MATLTTLAPGNMSYMSDYFTKDVTISTLLNSTSAIIPPIHPTLSDADCGDIHLYNGTMVCGFVKSTADCLTHEGFIQYTVFAYCSFSLRLLPLAITILLLWWLFLFAALALCADDYFCPSLVVIAKTLRMSDNIAGVTLLAFGNGAPDVFSSIAAITNAKNGDVGLAFGALLGAGIFVTTVVAGSVCCVRPFHAMERPMLRDLIFYIVTVWLTFYVLYDGHINLPEAIGFFCLYIVYVIFVIVSRIVYQRRKSRRRLLALPPNTDEPGSVEDSVTPRISATGTNIQDEYESDYSESGHHPVLFRDRDEALHDSLASPDPSLVTFSHVMLRMQSLEDLPSPFSTGDESTPLIGAQSDIELTTAGSFLSSVTPISKQAWRESRWYGKIYQIFTTPSKMIMTLTTPVVNLEEDKHNWNRHLNCLHCAISPVVCVFLAKYQFAFHLINGVCPVWVLFLLGGLVLAIVVYFTSKNEVQPRYHWVFAYAGFAVAVIWIQAIASEIVNLLQTFGVVFNLSNAILGLTLLAWGNSIGDLVADVVMAKQGKPRTGISACFAGPMFNLLLGIGIPFTKRCIEEGTIPLKMTLMQVVLVAFLMFSLASTLVIATVIKFRLNRIYGAYLFVLYALFLTIAILVEVGVITM